MFKNALCVKNFHGSTLLLLTVLVLSLTITQAQSACPADFAGYLLPRLIIGQQARVIPDVTVNIRPQPGLNQARIGSASTGMTFAVLAGPACVDGFVWWQGDVGGVVGWLAEGRLEDNEYYLEARGELVLITLADGTEERYIHTSSSFIEPEGCLRPPDDYTIVTVGHARLNARTLFMLEQAQRIYEQQGGQVVNFRQLIVQGSYNPGGVAASFGTHDGGGAVDISVRYPADFSIMTEEIAPMLRALRTAGFAAWLREPNELYHDSPIHIHAIAIGDIEASPIAQQQVNGDFGYLRGFNGLPPEDGQAALPDRNGPPIICEWMVELGFSDMRESTETGR